MTRRMLYNQRRSINQLYLYGGGVLPYNDRVLATNPIAYFVADGATNSMSDLSPNGFAATATNTSEGSASPVGDNTSLAFNGTDSRVNIYSAGFASAFDLDEGSIVVWAKVANAGVWTDGQERVWAVVLRNGGNRVYIRKDSSNNIEAFRQGDSGFIAIVQDAQTPTDWFVVLFSWSVTNDETLLYYNGVQVASNNGGVAATGSGLLSTFTNIGVQDSSLNDPWLGDIDRVIIWNHPVDDAILALATP